MEKIPNFIEIKNAGSRTGSNYIAITRNGTFSLYSGFYRAKKIKNFKKCIFLVDKVQKLIGIQFGNEELGTGAYTINHGEKTASINSSNIFNEEGLNKNEWYGKYEPVKYESSERNNVYMIDLDKKKPINRKSKKEKKEE